MSQNKINSKTVIRKIFESPDPKGHSDKHDRLSAFVKDDRGVRSVFAGPRQALGFWSFGAHEFGGLDLGNDSIKFVLLKQERKGLVLRDLQIEKILHPEPGQKAGPGKGDERLNLLVKIASRVKSKAKVGISLNDPSLYVDLLKVPHGSEEELREGVRKEIMERNLIDSENSFFDFISTSQGSNGGSGAIDELLVAAAPRNLVYREFEIVQSAGFKVQSIEPGVLAAFQAVSRVRKWQNTERVMILDIGYRFSNLSLVAGGRLFFNRAIPIAGERFTKAVAESLGVNLLKAEQLKLQHGLKMLSTGGGEPPALNEGASVSKALELEVGKLLGEVERSFQFAFSKESEAEGNKISGIVLLGGGSRMRALSSLISERLEAPVYDLDLWAEIEADNRVVDKELLDESRALTAVALGLGLRIKE